MEPKAEALRSTFFDTGRILFVPGALCLSSENRIQKVTGNRGQVTVPEISRLSPVPCHLFPTLTTASKL